MAFALGKDRDEHVGAGHLFAAGRLDVNDRALDHALEAGGRLGILIGSGRQVGEFGVDVFEQVAAQDIQIDIAGAHDGGRILVVDQREQQMLERGVFLMTLAGEGQRLVESLFKATGEGRHGLPHFFSITHCRGC